MHTKRRSKLAWVLGAVLAPLFASCAANTQMKAALDEREQENRQLREERSTLKGDMRDLQYEKEALETSLAEANARLLEEPERGKNQSIPGLDEVGVGYGMRDGKMVLTIPAEITFPSGKAELSAGGKKALAAVARELKSSYADGEYWIEGHTDSDPIQKSKFPTNRDLSLARAMAVLQYFVEEGGISDGRCVVAGWGEYRPVAKNDSKGKPKNRRVEIVVLR